MTHNFNRTILREYDVRGIVGQTLSTEDAYALGRSYAALAVSEGAKRVAVGRDGRTHSPDMEQALVCGLTEGGLDVVRIGMALRPCSTSPWQRSTSRAAFRLPAVTIPPITTVSRCC
jgi:phosphomannomutase